MTIAGCGERALTVYGPEAIVSGLVADLDAFWAREAGVVLVERFLVLHDAASITRFYEMTGSTSGTHWPLVIDLFDGRPCLASIWSGPKALPRMQRLKGATQPCNASPDTIRGNFACDNPVCNLIHVSDSADMAAEEIAILRSRALEIRGRVTGAVPATPIPSACRHSSLWTFVDILHRIDPTLGASVHFDPLAVAATSAKQALEALRSIGDAQPHLHDAINAFFEGRYADLLFVLPAGFRMNAWERLIVECGSHSTPLWIEKLGLQQNVE